MSKQLIGLMDIMKLGAGAIVKLRHKGNDDWRFAKVTHVVARTDEPGVYVIINEMGPSHRMRNTGQVTGMENVHLQYARRNGVPVSQSLYPTFPEQFPRLEVWTLDKGELEKVEKLDFS